VLVLVLAVALVLALEGPEAPAAAQVEVVEKDDEILIRSAAIEAAVRKRGYVSGVAGGSFLDRRSGFREVGFGLDIVDWILEPGSDAAYRDRLEGDLAYDFDNAVHGKVPKRSIEGPQICTRAKEVDARVVRGRDFAAVKLSYRYRIAAPGKKTGSLWEQWLVFPAGKRWFLSADWITSANAGEAPFLRIDMPGHIKHRRGDTFSEVYLSYHGRIPAAAFFKDFPPDEKFIYRREESKVPRRFIRAYRLRDPQSGREGPWLAGMTLDPAAVYEAWCHQRGYVCMIQEIGGRPIQAGDSFGAAFITGFFDSLEEMHEVYDAHAGHDALEVEEGGWKLVESPRKGGR
jgi:hypothetical protein